MFRQLIINFVFLAGRKISMFRVSEFWAHSFYSSFFPDYQNNLRFFWGLYKSLSVYNLVFSARKKIACRAGVLFQKRNPPLFRQRQPLPNFFLNRPNSRSVESPNRSHSKIRRAYPEHPELTSWCCVIGLPVNSSCTPVSFAIAPSAKKSSKMAEARAFFLWKDHKKTLVWAWKVLKLSVGSFKAHCFHSYDEISFFSRQHSQLSLQSCTTKQPGNQFVAWWSLAQRCL